MLSKPTSAYIHIPFCTQICYYCDFSKVFIKNQPVDAYLQALIKEIQHYKLPQLRTLYIGGGTPSALSASQLDYLLTNLSKEIDLSHIEEFTIEANPGDLTKEKIQVLQASACNRVSLGVQTFDDGMLKRIGRSHNRQQIYETIEALKEAGLTNISIDLIYALPDQTLDQVKDNVARALDLDIPHLSLYSLILEQHTIFMNRQKRGQLHLPGEDVESEMFEYILSELEAHGFEHYEISNFTKPGFESRHNLMYWDNAEYYGLGAGASGYLAGMRYRNRGPIQHYLTSIQEKGHARLHEEQLTQKEMMEEQMFLGLRKKAGVSITDFQTKFGVSFDRVYGPIADRLKEEGLLQEEGDRLRMTKRGLFLGDTVAERFILDEGSYGLWD
ncbi:radical SAM family heme chaperone HemW [Streptococcus sp. DD13]|uniref:radical SAM family heme chaperone HemW n=1 Tax=Streptococcus sp. DD13 TaxID=1777881 RepID=UPI000796164E|nr:radical SAM family heme chaperone HemW [Streptococcus sp. DD13]KXT79014.1 putative coproporphyrinogen III oxidase of BS HemN-type, oxygen-independent [Streptococcus sp. DD13]